MKILGVYTWNFLLHGYMTKKTKGNEPKLIWPLEHQGLFKSLCIKKNCSWVLKWTICAEYGGEGL